MALRRYALYNAPISHLNGKLQKADYKCSFQTDTDDNGHAYLYGYMHKRYGISRYAYRNKCRNLSVKPITASEGDNNFLFQMSVQTAAANYAIPEEREKAFIQFRQQKQYISLWQFCIAQTRLNAGFWPF